MLTVHVCADTYLHMWRQHLKWAYTSTYHQVLAGNHITHGASPQEGSSDSFVYIMSFQGNIRSLYVKVYISSAICGSQWIWDTRGNLKQKNMNCIHVTVLKRGCLSCMLSHSHTTLCIPDVAPILREGKDSGHKAGNEREQCHPNCFCGVSLGTRKITRRERIPGSASLRGHCIPEWPMFSLLLPPGILPSVGN